MRWAAPRAATTTPTARTTRSTWFDWASADTALRDFTRSLIAFRTRPPGLPPPPLPGRHRGLRAAMVHPRRHRMNGADWADPGARAIAIYLDGSDDPDRAEDGTPLLDDDFLVLVNSWWEPLDFVLPPTRPGAAVARTRSTATTPPPPPERANPGRGRSGNRRPPVRRGAVRSAPGLTAPLPSGMAPSGARCNHPGGVMPGCIDGVKVRTNHQRQGRMSCLLVRKKVIAGRRSGPAC